MDSKNELQNDKDNKIKENVTENNINEQNDNGKIKENINNNSSNDNILKPYEDLSPLELVETIEKYYDTFLNESEELNKNKLASLHILSNYKLKTNLKYKLLEFQHKKNLSDKLTQKIRNIMAIKVIGDNIFIAEDDGTVRHYSIETGMELPSFRDTKNNLNEPITALDITPTLEFMICGYINGIINLWDLKNNSIIHTIKVHTQKVMALQFTKITEKKKFEILSTDFSGQLLKIVVTKAIFGVLTKVEDTPIYKDDTPTYIITQFKPLKNKEIVLGAFGNFNRVKIYILRPVLTFFFEIEKPDYLIGSDENILPDIAFGWGCEPIEETGTLSHSKLNEPSRKNEMMLAVSWGEVIFLYSMTAKEEDFILKGDGPIGYYINDSPIVRVAFVSSSILYIFDKNSKLKIINTAFTEYGELTETDREKFIYNRKALVEDGEVIDKYLLKLCVNEEKNSGIDSKDNLYCYRNFIHNMTKQIFLLAKGGFYIGKVLDFKEIIDKFVQSKEWFSALALGIDIFQGNITAFPDVPINTKKRKEFLFPFMQSLVDQYIDHYFNGETKNEEEEQEKIDIHEELSNKTEIIEETKIIEKKKQKLDFKDLNESINVTIEFCIGIEGVDYLLTNIESIFRAKGKSDLFYKIFEPFIFNNQLINEKLNYDSIVALYLTYKNYKETTLLSHLLTHFSINVLSQNEIKLIGINEHLFTLLIYIFSHGKNYEDYFLPVVKIYEVFKKKIQEKIKEDVEHLSNKKNLNYVDLYGTNSIKGINNMEESTEYIGHKLLWYIYISLKGDKFSLIMDYSSLKFDEDSQDYKHFVALMFYFLLNEEVFNLLLRFDSFSLFYIFSQILLEPRLLKIIKEYDFNLIKKNFDLLYKKLSVINFVNKEIVKDYPDIVLQNIESNETEEKQIKKSNINYNEPNNVVENIITMTNKTVGEKFFIDHDLSLFLVGYASKSTEINQISQKIKKEMPNAFLNLLNYYEIYNEKKKNGISEIDKFKCHKIMNCINISKDDVYFKKIQKNLLELLESYYQFKEDELNKIISKGINSPFTRVKIKLYEINKSYVNCIELFLENKNNDLHEDVFSFLQRTFESFRYKNEKVNESDLINLKKAVNSKINELAKKDIKKTNVLIQQFYSEKEKISVIKLLDENPKLQLDFIEQIIKPSKGGSKNIDYNSNDNTLEFLLLWQINLLIKLNRIDEIVPSIDEQIQLRKKTKNKYPIEKCKEICKLNNLDNAQIYLFEQTDDYDKALELTMQRLKNKYGNYKDNENVENYNIFKEEMDICINICQKNSDKVTKDIQKEKLKERERNKDKSKEIKNNEESLNKIKKSEKMWFELLKCLYDFSNDIKNNKKNQISQTVINDEIKIENVVSKEIISLLEKMSVHVEITNIIEYLSNTFPDAEFKEFKTIILNMLRENKKFGCILQSMMDILGKSIINIEEQREKVSMKGNIFNTFICDVCKQNFSYLKNEDLVCFGCGHQAHKNCISLNNGQVECIICRSNDIESIIIDDINDENKIDNEKTKKEEIVINVEKVNNEKEKKNLRKNKINAILSYDKKYLEKVKFFSD